MVYIRNIYGDTTVQAVINISEHANRVLNIVKAKYGLTTKAQAIEKMAEEYEDFVLEPKLRPEFAKELKETLRNPKFRRVKNVSDIFE